MVVHAPRRHDHRLEKRGDDQLALRAHEKELKAQAKALPHLARWWRFVEGLEPMQKVAQEF